MNTMPPTTPARAQTKQIVSFVVACVLLVLGLLILLLPTGLNFDPGSSSESTEAGLPGGELIGLMMVAAALAFIGMLVFGFVATCWGIGLILAARLALNKTDKPKWLWIASTVLTTVYAGLIAVVIVPVVIKLIRVFLF